MKSYLSHLSQYFPKNVSADLSASFVVFLVAVPLSMGIALASGAPVVSGLIAAACGGIVVGLFAGAPLQVSGPAAGLTVLVFGYVQKFGIEAMSLITFLAGVLQIVMGFGKVAKFALMIPPAVIHGMLAGIGILIAVSQTQVILGGSPKGTFIENLSQIPHLLAEQHVASIGLGLGMLSILFGWTFLKEANYVRGKWVEKIQAPLIGIVLLTIVTQVFRIPVDTVNLGHLNIDLEPKWPNFDSVDLSGIFLASLVLGFVASAESLLSVLATDKLHSGPRAKMDRELLAQGVGNSLSGFLGGLPVTGVIVRSSANITSGAKTRLSTILHGLWIVLCLAFFRSYLELIPLSALAGLLVFVGLRLVKLQHFKTSQTFGEGYLYLATVAGVVLINLLAGIGIGFGLALLRILATYRSPKMNSKVSNGNQIIEVEGSASFLLIPRLKSLLDRSQGSATLLLSGATVDQSVSELVDEWTAQDPKNRKLELPKS